MGDISTTGDAAAEVQARLDELLWYHTIDVAPGVATRGWWDLRHALPLLPFPDVKGKRCLDVATWDGFYAYEMERRGAAEVVAVDLSNLAGLDYPPEVRADKDFDPSLGGEQDHSAGFRLLNEVLGSSAQLKAISIYDLDPDVIGTFDVVVVGSLLVHLRDPIRAMDAVRKVTRGELLSIDYIHPPVNLLARRRPLFELRGEGRDFQWWLASDAGLRQVLKVAGFDISAMSKPFLLRPGALYASARSKRPRALGRDVSNQIIARDSTPGGHLHRAYRCRPRF